jgi:hypothetical protein
MIFYAVPVTAAMGRGKMRYASGAFVALAATVFGSPAGAQSATSPALTVEQITPGTTVGDALSNSSNCHIIIQDGKIYRVCPFIVPQTLKNIIKKQPQ